MIEDIKYKLNLNNSEKPSGRPQASVLQPRKKSNRYNSSMLQFNSVEGTGYIFPSWLSHYVPPTTTNRISLSWNIILRGEYGEPNSLQNASI